MFTPIKNFITYIQKNASGNSIFGGNSTTEESAKMETENMKTETAAAIATETRNENETMQTESKDLKERNKSEIDAKIIEVKLEEKQENEEKHNKEAIDSERSDPIDSETNTSKLTTKTTTTTKTFEYEDDDDIETQIESSIMLKKPIKTLATNGSEILEVKKTSNINCSIVISHDYNRNHALTPIDDELEDFRHDPMEVLGTTSSPCSNQQVDEFCSVGSAEEVLERDATTADENEEEQMMRNETEEDQKVMDETDLEAEDEEKDSEAGNELQGVILLEEGEEEEEEDEPFLDMDEYKSSNVIVLDEVDLNASTTSVDTNNTADDPLAIACEEQEAFAADKAAALEELNLLNNLQTSQDEDTRTTTDEDLHWLKTDLDDNQPSCSSKVLIKDNVSEVTPEKEERNGEGSDSGLGSETSALHTTTTSITDTSQLNMTTTTPSQTPTQVKTKDNEKLINANVLQLTKSPPKDPLKPYRSNLKRRLEVDDDVLGNLTSSGSALSEHSSINGSIQKKPKRSINFDSVQVYYFPRQQGFSCVPSAGGCTLGMGARHVAFKTLTLAEHAAELRRAHRMQLQEINPRGSSSDDSEESEEDYLSEGSGSDLDGESNGFLQPVSPKQRRALLKAAGIRKIDPSEKADCRNIRNSREVCGCTCRDFCDPETCSCSQSGIKCQVDRDMFPCGCSRDACGNIIGRVEFNPTRVRTHYIHTLMRLEMENRQQQNPYSSAVASPMHPSTPSSYYQNHLQPQSNYSSGYASPAYNTASDLHQQTVANSYYHTQTPSTSNSLYGQQNAIEMSHNGSAATATTAPQYSMDSLDSSLFGGTTTATPSYGELMPVTSYHYGNVQTQVSPYNSYHNSSPYINTNNTINSLTTPSTYSSCAVPSIPPYGTATTTEASGVYHSVSSLTSLETTTAPSCGVNGASSLENDSTTTSSFISLSTPLASSSRLSQINDLLQHNRNTTTALVAVSQNIGATNSNSAAAVCSRQVNGNHLQNANASSCSSINTPPIEDAHKTCMTYEELAVPPLKPAPIVAVIENDTNTGPVETTATSLPATNKETMETSLKTKLPETTATTTISTLNNEFLTQTSQLSKSGQNSTGSSSSSNNTTTVVAVSANLEPSTIEVAAGK
ncbi:AXIN1 up-regulated 1 isoform 1-T2 [Cochliomyia hominivorax]